MFKDRLWILCQYEQLCKIFCFSLFRKLATHVPIDNLIDVRKIIYHRLYFSLLPFRVWNHLFQCRRSQYESNVSVLHKSLLRNSKICKLIEKKLAIDVLDFFPVQLSYGVITKGLVNLFIHSSFSAWWKYQFWYTVLWGCEFCIYTLEILSGHFSKNCFESLW